MRDIQEIAAMRDEVVRGLGDFVRGAGFTDVLVCSSGGMDSAMVASLAVDALGLGRVHTLMMKTQHTSQLSVRLAKELAGNLKVEHEEICIQGAVGAMEAALSFKPSRTITMENVQARVRGVLAMTYSNEKGWMVLSCGNKSEAMQGYCTLYGDTCGSLMPIGDIFKTEVYQMAELYPQIPREIITRPASAELSPGQRDTDILPPYDVLDPILRKIEKGQPLGDGALEQSVLARYKASQFKLAQCPPALKLKER